MIISLSYSAKMVAMRTVETPQLPINSLADVLDRSDWDFGFIGKALERGIFEVGRYIYKWSEYRNTNDISVFRS
jgi:hypothetical protein